MVKNNSFQPKKALTHRPLWSAIALILAGGVTNAATIDVSGDCTLVAAINNANSDTDTDGSVGCPAGSDSDTLNLPAKAQLVASLPTITSIITINGNGSAIDGQGNRPFTISKTGNLTLRQLTVTGGFAKDGGGIFNEGKLTITDSTITGNFTFPQCDYYCFGSNGGGIFNSGTATLANSSVTKNSVNTGFTINGESGFGGGIFNTGKMTLKNSIVSKNTALGGHRRWVGPSGGGIHNYGDMTLTNTTVSGNRASEEGGGIRNLGIMSLVSSTVSGNKAKTGGGLVNGFFADSTKDVLTLTNSTVSGNTSGGIVNSSGGIVNAHELSLVSTTLSDNLGLNIKNSGTLTLTNSLLANSTGDCNNTGGTLVMQGVNLVEDGSCDVTAQGGLSGDPRLLPLSSNGGPTQTHSLLVSNPAINKADDSLCPVLDQRGVLRPQAEHCDIGAFERIASSHLSVRPIITFFDSSSRDNSLVGTGEDLTIQKLRLNTIRTRLSAIGDFISQKKTVLACADLKATLSAIDRDGTPDFNDYVTGSNADVFAGQVTLLHNILKLLNRC